MSSSPGPLFVVFFNSQNLSSSVSLGFQWAWFGMCSIDLFKLPIVDSLTKIYVPACWVHYRVDSPS
jgi:hypothetical protein